LPPRLSDVMFDLFLMGLFSARWSSEIEQEFVRNWPRVVAKVMSGLSSSSLTGETKKHGGDWNATVGPSGNMKYSATIMMR